MQTKAAVVLEERGGVQIRTVELAPPGRGELLVRLAASGVCHTDQSFMDGTFPFGGPTVLGHEGAGVVEEVGAEVTGFAPGDHVILNWMPFCGRCYFCIQGSYSQCANTAMAGSGGGSRFSLDGQPLGSLASVASMSQYTVVSDRGAVKIDSDIPLDKAALIGCGVQTGVGAVVNSARVHAGSTCAVWGCGGVGLNAIQGCVIAGATRIIAVDVAPQKLEFARKFGATDIVDAGGADPVAAVMELTGGIGADYTFEVVGSARTMEQAYHAVRRGGTCTIVGAAGQTEVVTLPAFALAITEKVLRGSFYGGGATPRDFPRLLEWYRQGRLQLDALITSTYALDDAPQAFADLMAGKNARGVLMMDR